MRATTTKIIKTSLDAYNIISEPDALHIFYL